MSEDKAPRGHKVKKPEKKKGLVIVNTGDGKGKSTASFGILLRAVGNDFNVAVVQFIKGKWKTGEQEAAKKYFGDKVEWVSFGEGFTWETQNLEKDLAIARKTWAKCVEFLHDDKHQVVIFDEINYVLKYNFLKVEDVIAELKKKPAMKHVVLTGGGAPPELIELADLATEMKLLKHPYYHGVAAQPGIEF